MKPAPLQLTDYFITSLKLEANPSYDPQKPSETKLETLQVVNEVEGLSEGQSEGSEWQVSLRIKQEIPEDENIPYSFDLNIQGIIFAYSSIPAERLERAVRANGPAMLFGAAREIIRAATGRGPWSPVIIPSTNFLTGLPPLEAKKKTAKKKKAASKTTTTKKATKKTAKKAPRKRA